MMKNKMFLLAMLLLCIFAACGDDDDDNNGNGNGSGTSATNPDGINGSWVCYQLEADVEADTEETRQKILKRLVSDETKLSIKLILEYSPEYKYYYFDYYIYGGETGGSATFKDNKLTTDRIWLAFERKDGIMYREYDFTDSFKEQYSDTKKAVQRMWLRKR